MREEIWGVGDGVDTKTREVYPITAPLWGDMQASKHAWEQNTRLACAEPRDPANPVVYCRRQNNASDLTQ